MPGLRVYRRLRSGSPDYELTAVYGAVARTDAQHRLREAVRSLDPTLPGQPQLLQIAVQL
ncbi:hypothetical protein TUM17559_22660 [Enterobacter cloacae]|nr:hypothetical protein TUM17559_22660 [Enterobacter cloacae]GJL11908.1 hypothetical protein TUM17572_17150 [Klebsiella oxytoca]